MSSPIPLPSFASGEVAPSLLGHIDLARLKSSAMTMRNLFVRFQGGAASRAGTAFVGYSKQTGRSYPPRLIPFQFNITQGLALEFGNQYMRVIYDGALVTEGPLVVTGATNAKPCVITVSSNTLQSATAVNTGVVSSYAPGDLVTLAGGTYSIPAQIQVVTTTLLSAGLATPGTGYAPSDTISLAGGTQTTTAKMAVSATQVVSATIAAAGSGGTNGTATVTGTTGTGTKFQAHVTIASGAIYAVNSISVGGAYTVNPTSLSAEPVTGGGLTGATLKIAMGVQAASVSVAGVFTANPVGGAFTQASTTGSGTGATFSLGLFGINTLTITNAGAYTVAPSSPASQASTTGSGLGATFTIVCGSANTFAVGDWIYLSGIGGMTQLNGRTAVIASTSGGYSLNDVFGNPIDATAFGTFSSDGSAARIYTLTTPYSEQDLPWLKIIESADVVSITCVNQETGTEYPPYDLDRISDDLWTLAQINMTPTVSPPNSAWGYATSIPYGSGANASYAYAVTAVNPNDGTESIASNTAYIDNAVDIAATAGSVTITWGGVAGVNEYNIYKAQPTYMAATINPNTTPATYTYNNCPAPPVGSLMGFVGSAYGTQFIDSNTLPDFSQVPPTHQNPFARGQIVGCFPAVGGGSGYTTASATITTSTGSGAVIVPVIVNGSVVAYIVQDAGSGYASTDTVTISGDGSGATATLSIGAQTGTYPGAVGYYQQRRVYGCTLNNPDTYFMSQPGSFTNFDSRIPTIDTDAIIGTPWSVQVNGIQWFVSMPGGLVVLTGLSAWQLTGAGGSSLNPQPISPSDQQAQPQAYNGCSATVPPIKINYDIIYVQAKGSTYRDMSYQFFTNIYTGTDLTINSPHLFLGYTIREHAWCEEPYKVLWSVRSDGVLLSMTYLKEQQITGWTRHDTYGFYQSVCSVVEPPVDALYLAVERTINGNIGYFIERMDNRIWTGGVESTWCVDCGLSYPQPTPAATLGVSSLFGVGSISGVTGLVGGAGYSSATYARVIDNNGQGPGTGATPVLTISGGVITGVTFSPAGLGYVNPSIVFIDPANSGSGASATCVLNTSVTFTASAGVFSAGNVGSVIRMGGGIGTITGYVSTTQVTATLTTPISTVYPNSGGGMQAQPAGAWTMTAPISKVTGFTHLIGAQVTGLADGNVIPPQVVAADGSITLATPASAITGGLGFQCQLQSVYVDALVNDVAGQRKKVSQVTARIEASRGLKAGSNQVDGSTLSPPILAPVWTNLDVIPDLGTPPFGGAVTPLYTGDVRLPVSGGYGKPGQVAIQQDNPLPMNILALIPEDWTGDGPEQKATPREKKRAA